MLNLSPNLLAGLIVVDSLGSGFASAVGEVVGVDFIEGVVLVEGVALETEEGSWVEVVHVSDMGVVDVGVVDVSVVLVGTPEEVEVGVSEVESGAASVSSSCTLICFPSLRS